MFRAFGIRFFQLEQNFSNVSKLTDLMGEDATSLLQLSKDIRIDSKSSSDHVRNDFSSGHQELSFPKIGFCKLSFLKYAFGY